MQVTQFFFNSRQTIQNKKLSYKNLQAEYLLIHINYEYKIVLMLNELKKLSFPKVSVIK